MPISADLATVAATDVRPKTSAPDAVGGLQNSDADFAATYERERQAQSAAEGGLPEASSVVSDIQSAPAAEGAVDDDEELLASSEDTEVSDEVAPDTTAVQELLLPLDLIAVTPPPSGAALPIQASADHEATLITATSASLAADGLDSFTGKPEAFTAKVSEDRALAPSAVSVDEIALASETPVADRQTDGTVEADPVIAADTALLLARTLGSSMGATAPDASVSATNGAASEVEITPTALLERGILAARMAQASGQTSSLPSAVDSGVVGTASLLAAQGGLPLEGAGALSASSVSTMPLAEDTALPAQTTVVVASQSIGGSVVEAEVLPSARNAEQVAASPNLVSTAASVVLEPESALSAKPVVASAPETPILPSTVSAPAAYASRLIDAPVVEIEEAGLPNAVAQTSAAPSIASSASVLASRLAGSSVVEPEPALSVKPVVASAPETPILPSTASAPAAYASRLIDAPVVEIEEAGLPNAVAQTSTAPSIASSASVLASRLAGSSVVEPEPALSAKPVVASAPETPILPSTVSAPAVSASRLIDVPAVEVEEASLPNAVAQTSAAPSIASSASVLASRLAGSSVVEPEPALSSAQALAPARVSIATTAAPSAGATASSASVEPFASAVPNVSPAVTNAVLAEVGADMASNVAPLAVSAVPSSLAAKSSTSSTTSPLVTDSTSTVNPDLQGDAQSASNAPVGSATPASNSVESATLLEPTLPSLAEDRSLAESSPERAPDTSLSTGSSKESLNTPSTPRLPVVVGQPLALQKSEWSQAAVDRVMWMSSQNLQSAEIRLDPAELGRMEVRIDMVKDQAQVTFMSAQAGVRDALESQLPRLRELFSQQGMNLLDVNVSDQSSSGAWQGSSEQGRGQRNSAQDSLTAIESDEAVFGTMDASTSRKDSTRSLVDYYA